MHRDSSASSNSSRRGALARFLGASAAPTGGIFARSWRSTGAKAQTALPAPPAVLNISLNVSDIDRSRHFYVDALGFEDAGKVVSHLLNAARVFFGQGGEAFLNAHMCAWAVF